MQTRSQHSAAGALAYPGQSPNQSRDTSSCLHARPKQSPLPLPHCGCAPQYVHALADRHLAAVLHCCPTCPLCVNHPPTPHLQADNMFSFTVSDLYCSDAATSNVHVIGRFTPHSSSPGARQDRPLLPAQTPEAQRAFILDRCLQTAKELVSAEHTAATAAVAATEAAAEGAPGRLSLSAAAAAAGGGLSTSSSSQQGAPAGSSVLGSLSSLGRLAWEVATGGGSSSSSRGRERLRMRLLAARAALESCSVRGELRTNKLAS
jgi:hypothetical protein